MSGLSGLSGLSGVCTLVQGPRTKSGMNLCFSSDLNIQAKGVVGIALPSMMTDDSL